MGDGDAAIRDVGEEGLDVAVERAAGRGISDVADARRASEFVDRAANRELVADQTFAAFHVEFAVVAGDDARCLLPAML